MEFDKKIIDEIRAKAIRLEGNNAAYNTLLEYIGDSQIVLLGEATHGTHEFYSIRAQITKRLIAEKGFNAIAIEGDWPDAYEVNKYIHKDGYFKASEAFRSFDRFPTWMWRNVPMIEFAEWLRDYNQNQQTDKKISFYGLDLYSFYRSIDIIISYLKKIDPEAAAEAQYHYSCFDNFRHDPQAYGYAVFRKVINSCSDKVIEQLRRLQDQDWEYLANNEISANESFYIEQNARVVKNAELYYRSLFFNEESSWNVRDAHMLETLNAIITDYKLRGIENPKIIIWAHNSHVGNAAATQMSIRGEYNIGQLVREQFGKKSSKSIGFTTYHGTVSAASDWHAPVERKIILEALPESYEALFHATQIPNFLLLLENMKTMPNKYLERAIGVIYRPETERLSHYFYANIVEQFDAIIHCDKTSAVEPLEKTSQWIKGEVPETYPSGF